MSGVPQANTAQAPPSRDFAGRAALIEEIPARAKRELINRIDNHIVTNVIDARAFIAGQTVHVLRAGRLAAAYRTVVDRMRPCVPRFERKTIFEASFQRCAQRIVGARSDVSLD